MGETRDNDAYEEKLLDYEEDEEKVPDSNGAKYTGEANLIALEWCRGYVGIHSSAFRDFLLKFCTPVLEAKFYWLPFLLEFSEIISYSLRFLGSNFSFGSQSVQHECIPQAILGMDVICQAKYGMGKTDVFVLSTLQQIKPVVGEVVALILCHTRELAYQICHDFERFSTYLPDIKVVVFYGGSPHFVVGTPGRILALSREKDLALKNVRHFILDYTDYSSFCLLSLFIFFQKSSHCSVNCVDMRKDVQEIFKMTFHDKQVMMFSATLKKEIRSVCKKFMQDVMSCGQYPSISEWCQVSIDLFLVPCNVAYFRMQLLLGHDYFVLSNLSWVIVATVTMSSIGYLICFDLTFYLHPMEIYVDDEAKLTLHGLVQHYIKLTELEKKRKLNDLLDALDFNQVVIFVKSVRRAAELNKLLEECNFPSICIHSGMSQEERFQGGHKRILVTTDLVGKGIDIERVNIVINYDMPDSADTYLHRFSRAGRFGTKGLAIKFVSSASDSDVLNQSRLILLHTVSSLIFMHLYFSTPKLASEFGVTYFQPPYWHVFRLTCCPLKAHQKLKAGRSLAKNLKAELQGHR
ncbi:hypothetical protein MKX01_031949 [Papaver californicum]|nr:hypothetical protein MKX01_031949 [Papaver californicum]